MTAPRTHPVPAPPVTAAQLMTAAQLSVRWQVPKSHVYRLSREGSLPTVQLGKYRRFRLDAVEKFEKKGGLGT